jgi:hypothetical protein
LSYKVFRKRWIQGSSIWLASDGCRHC